MTRIFNIAGLFVLATLISASTAVGQFNHPDALGTTFDYTNIFETTNTNGPLFGAPTANGNNLDFPAAGFAANATGPSVDFLNGMIELDVSSNTGQTFNSIELSEFGVYFNSGASAFSSVTTFLFVTVGGQTFSDSVTQSFSGTGSGVWDASFKIAIPDTLDATVQIHNILLSEAGPGDVASISKRDVDLFVGGDGPVVPEPTSAAILFAGLLGTALRRRRS